jgi:hypothetical protein
MRLARLALEQGLHLPPHRDGRVARGMLDVVPAHRRAGGDRPPELQAVREPERKAPSAREAAAGMSLP